MYCIKRYYCYITVLYQKILLMLAWRKWEISQCADFYLSADQSLTHNAGDQSELRLQWERKPSSQTTISLWFSFQGFAKKYSKNAECRMWSQFVTFLRLSSLKSDYFVETSIHSKIWSEINANVSNCASAWRRRVFLGNGNSLRMSACVYIWFFSFPILWKNRQTMAPASDVH